MRDSLVGLCRQYEQSTGYLPTTSGPPVPVGKSCDVLAKWDLRENTTSRGAILFRRFFDNLSGYPENTAYAYSGTSAPYWSTPFSSTDAVHTPAGLNTADPEVSAALGDAVDDLNSAKLPLDVAVGTVQYVEKNGVRYPIHGGTGDPNGDFNAIWTGWVGGKGLTQPDGGSSFVQVVTWHGGKCPDARTILTYSQSTNPSSPYFADQTRMFSRKAWVNPGFCEREILADRNLTIQRFGKVRCTSRRTITYRLPLRKRGERLRRVRATVNGKRVKAKRVGRGVRVSLRGRPKARYRIRVAAKTSRKRTIKLDRRARTCAKKQKKQRKR